MAPAGNPAAAQPLGVPGTSLFRSKLRAPVMPDRVVRRPRLHELLDELATAPLTLVVAPAGSGKTSLLASWSAESATPSAWLSLDEADRSPAQFWTGVVAALQTLLPGHGERAMALLRQPDALAEAVGALLDDLEAESRADTVFIIDDGHLVDDESATATSLELFLLHLPPWLHVVLAARRMPRLPIDRLRARGHLGEVHFAELRFSQKEAENMLARLAPSLADDRVSAAAARAGGWAAGIQLAALAARSERARQDDTALIGEGDVLVEDYVWHEVLAAESPELVDVLVATAVVERVNPSLAQALTDRADVGEVLARAEARGLFVSRRPAGWFEVHALVREVLVAMLATRSPSRLSKQHIRAARWFEEAGETPLALEHWLAADRPLEALRLLAAHNATLYDSGREAIIVQTIAGIPLRVASADLETIVQFAWCQVLVDRRRFLQTVDQITEWASRTIELSEPIRGRCTMLQSFAATVRGDWAAGGDLAERAMRELGDGYWQDFLGRFGWNMVARDIALSERWEDSGADVDQARHALSRDPERRLAFEGTRALGEALAGRPVDALRVAAGVRQAAAVTNMTILRAELCTAEAIAHRELGELPQAIAELRSLAEAPVEPLPYCQVLACLELAQAGIDEGDLGAAERAFGQAAQLVETEFAGAGGRAWLARVGTQLALATGDIGQARRWSEQLDDRFWGGICAARIDLAEGRRAHALAALDAVTPRCVRHEIIRDLLLARAQSAHELSVKYVTNAVEQAVANGLLQTVASEGAEITRSVELAAWRAPQPWLDRLRRAATPGVRAQRASELELVRALTDREREVLRLLPSRLTLREIAAELYISMNTLKFHLRVIYRKLGCSSRGEAAEIARATSSARRPGQAPNTLRR